VPASLSGSEACATFLSAMRSPRFILLAAVSALLVSAASCARLSPARGHSQQEKIFAARDKVLPALVHIEPVLEIYQAGERGRLAVTGSGVIFSEAGYILTNTHVVGGAQLLTCTLFNHEEVEARLVGVDPLSDLAVIKIDMSLAGEGVRHAPLGDSSRLQVGEMVIAMGSPLGLARSLSLGVVSSLDRYFPESMLPSGTPTGTYNTWIQTDAAINPGNSGGPLLDLDGRVVGINARAIPLVGENLGFAIPINLAREVAAELIQKGEISRSWIGVDWQQMKGLGGHFGLSEDTGALVSGIAPGSPAADAGLKAGDVVVRIANRPVSARFEEDLPRLQKFIADLPIGGEVPIDFIRDGEQASSLLVTRDRPNVEAGEFECQEWGFTVQEITEERAQALRLTDRRGVIVSGVKPNSFADEAGLRRNDVMVVLEGRTIEDLKQYRTIYREMVESRRGQVLVHTQRGRLRNFHVLKPTYDRKRPDAEAS